MTLEQIYDSLPKLECKRKCQQCCGPIGMTQLELDQLEQFSGMRLETAKPYPNVLMTCCLVCPLLNPIAGMCMAYEVRPLICRLWGLVKKMRCPWGCEPERWLSDAEAHALLKEMDIADAAVNKRLITFLQKPLASAL